MREAGDTMGLDLAHGVRGLPRNIHRPQQDRTGRSQPMTRIQPEAIIVPSRTPKEIVVRLPPRVLSPAAMPTVERQRATAASQIWTGRRLWVVTYRQSR